MSLTEIGLTHAPEIRTGEIHLTDSDRSNISKC